MPDRHSSRSAAQSPRDTSVPRLLDAARELEFYRFGGLKGLRRHGHFKEVRSVDPLTGTMLHFPSPLHADNWLVSAFGRTLICSVPNVPMQVLDRGRFLTVRCSLVLQTAQGTLADFVVKSLDEKAARKWAQFQTVARAHGMQPVLRTASEIRSCPQRLQNLERMRQTLVQHLQDPSVHDAGGAVERYMMQVRTTSLGELFTALEPQRFSRGAIACGAIHLYRTGAINMNVSEAAYGQQTRIELL
jgi:hypothetical protein